MLVKYKVKLSELGYSVIVTKSTGFDIPLGNEIFSWLDDNFGSHGWAYDISDPFVTYYLGFLCKEDAMAFKLMFPEACV